MSRLKKLKTISSKPDFARLLGLHPSFLTRVLYFTDPEKKYHKFEIPKKSGGNREINAPNSELKQIQSSLNNLLLDCLDEINRERFPNSGPSPMSENNKVLKVKCNNEAKQPTLSHGFERNRSILTNAMMHLGQKNVLNIDLLNFFGCFNFGRVRGFFIKDNNFSLDPHIATVIAQIACHEDELPQGSPCSPVITNLITHILDIRLAALAKKNSCTYTRYADDITFSTRKKVFSSAIVSRQEHQYTVSKKLRSEITRAGFFINDKKTRVQYKNSRQNVTGLIVNKKPNVRKEYWRTARAQCHSLFTRGSFKKRINEKITKGNINELEGQLNFIDQLDRYNRLRQKPPLNPKYHLKVDAISKNKAKQRKYLFSGREKTLSRFLFYRLFYANDKPTILTEGKTDNIYLKAAIRMLSKKYPLLSEEETSKSPYRLLVNFLNYTKRTKFLLELYAGADYLKDFVDGYKMQFEYYSAPQSMNPVIIVVDNDPGPEHLLKILCSKYPQASVFPSKGANSKPTSQKDIREADFVHVCHNLYLVLTPLSPTKSKTDIECFFKEKDRLRVYNGKCFGTVKDRETGKGWLSKNAFATHIIKAQNKHVDFSGLEPLLKRIEKVISYHRTKMSKNA